jgi:8-oxo-dGTP diphosphatase
MPEYNLWAEKVCHIYKAKPVIKKHEPLELEHTAIWMSPTVARKLLTNDGDLKFVRDCFNI